MKLNVTTWCGPLVHGEVPHRLLFAFSVVGEAIGTLMPRPAIVNVCWTLHPDQEFEQRIRHAVDVLHAADRAGDLAPHRVAQRGTAVVAVDRHVHLGAGGHREVGGVHPLLGLRVLDEVGDPVRFVGHRILRVGLQHDVHLAAAGVRRVILDWRRGEDEMDGDEGHGRDHHDERARSVVTRAGSDTGYHLVSLRHPMHTVAASVASAATRQDWRARPTREPAHRSQQRRCRATPRC